MYTIITRGLFGRKRHLVKGRDVRRQLWKSLNIIVAVTTIVNVSALGTFIAPREVLALSVDTYDQCSNDDGNGYATGDQGCRWINGNLQGNNSLYAEGDATVQRLWKADFAPGSTHTVTIEYGTTKGGKHAYDYLTSWDWSENWIAPPDSDLCQDIDGCETASQHTLPIPHDPNGSGQFETGTRNFLMRGGHLNSASIPTIVSGSYAGDSDTAITVEFTVDASGSMCSGGTCGVALIFGAHIAKTSQWQPFDGTTGATSIPGSPYHVKLAAIDGDASGQRDNQMQAGAIANVVIEKQTNPDGSTQQFTFNSQTGALQGVLSDGQQLIASLNGGTYAVSEASTAGWTLTGLVCVDPSNNTTVDLGTRTANINVANGETVSCVFTNSESPTLTVTKVVNNNHGGTATVGSFPLKVDQTSVTSGQSNTFVSGAHTVSETQQPGYTQVSITGDCDANGNVTLNNGDHKTCTITNEDIAPTLKLVKTVDNGDGGNANAGQWILTATGNGGFSDAGDSTTFHTVRANTAYALSENGPAGYSTGSWSCDSGSLQGSTVTLGLAQNATCTITNNDLGPTLKLIKNIRGGTSTAVDWQLSANGTGGFTDSGDSTTFHPVLANTAYTLGESGPSGYTAGSWSCDGGNLNGNSLTLGLDEDITCEITNVRDQGTIELQKVWSGTASLTFLRIGTSQGGTQIANAPVVFANGSTGPYPVDTGTYYVSEDQASLIDYDASLICADDSGFVPVNTITGAVDVAKDQHVVCVFTNARQTGSITVNKQFDHNGDGQIDATNPLGWTWDLFNGYQDNAGGSTLPVDTGSYTVTEDAVANYSTTWSCNDQTGGNGTLIAANVGNHQDLVCTFVNTRDTGTIIVHKLVDTDADGTFESGDSVANGLGFAWGIDPTAPIRAMGSSEILTTGDYTISENSVAGYHFVGWADGNPDQFDGDICGQGELNTVLPVPVNVSSNETSAITFCNARDSGTITVLKNVDENGDGDTADAGEIGLTTWTWDIQGGAQNTPTGSSQKVLGGSYIISEDQRTGYHVTRLVCTDNRQSLATTVGVSTNVTVANNSNIVCTFTNTKDVTTITLDKTGPATATVGSQYTYTLAWTVSGNTAATNAVITDPIPTNTTFVSQTCGTTTPTCTPSTAGNIAKWELGTRAPGSSGTVTMTVQVNSNLTTSTTLTNTGTFDTDQTPPVSDTVETRVSVVLGATAPNLTLTKAVNTAEANPGDTVTYTMVVTNIGDGDATNVVLTDNLPAGFTYLDGSKTRSWTIGTLAAGATTTTTVTVQIDDSIASGSYINHAFVTADDLEALHAYATVTIKAPQVLGLSTTGVGPRDYAIFGLGLIILALGFMSLRGLGRAPHAKRS